MSDPREAVGRLRDAYNSHDLDAIGRSFGERSVLVSPDGIAEGGEEIASLYGQFIEAFPDTKVTIQSVVMFRDTVAAEYTISGTHKGQFLVPGGGVCEPTGRPITVRACSFSTVEDDLIVSHRVYYDQLELGTQIGGRLHFEECEE